LLKPTTMTVVITNAVWIWNDYLSLQGDTLGDRRNVPDFPDFRSISSKVSISGSGILNPYFSCDNFSHSVSEHQEE
ncbi:hypothetical protein, partial [Coprococcus eutactus]|uniref:hypothetical protein n=1 Tax=Coprococcus eutactus TaxID=33043 RepID=UPI003D2764C9